jgi:hypothetical protein
MLVESNTMLTPVNKTFYEVVWPMAKAELEGKPEGTTVSYPKSGGGSYGIAYPHESPAWVTPKTVSFSSTGLGGSGFPNAIIDDAAGMIGRGRVNSHRFRYTVEVKKILIGGNDPQVPASVVRGYQITARNIGEVEDLYDFNWNCGGVNRIGAGMQLGYSNGTYGRGGARIYRWKVKFDNKVSWEFY